jgi:hypothetical protein
MVIDKCEVRKYNLTKSNVLRYRGNLESSALDEYWTQLQCSFENLFCKECTPVENLENSDYFKV